MHRTAALLLLLLFSAGASAATAWTGTSRHAVTAGTGDVLQPGGATLSLSAESTGEAAFVGAITSVDAARFQGRDLRLRGSVLTREGKGIAALWLRADGPDARLGFASSAGQPVRVGEGAQSREVRLYVPAGTATVKLGVTLNSPGRVEVADLALTAESAGGEGISAYDMLAPALAIIRENALNAGNVDWPMQQQRLLTPALKELPAAEAYSRIREVLDALADRHSFLQRPHEASTYRDTAIATRAIESRQLHDIGYVLVPGLRGTHARDGEAFATQLCEQVAARAPSSTRGWIVDLREDTGGNMWPMLNGLHALLGADEAGAFRNREGVTTRWRSRPSKACAVDLSQSPVAVLLGPKTASAGEALAVAFRARPGTRFFCLPTAGRATSNRAYPLPDGGALRLTTAVVLDRSGDAYPQGITPEHRVAADQDAIDVAAAWLRSLP